MPDTSPRWYHGLGLRTALLMSLALLPLGLIAVDQTRRLTQETRQRAELSLLALTELNADAEAEVMQRAFGAGEVIMTILEAVQSEPDRCRDALRAVIRQNPTYSFIGVVPRDGIVRCSSADAPFDVSGTPGFEERMAQPRDRVRLNLTPSVSGQPVIMAQHPFFTEEGFGGYLSISIPQERIVIQEDADEQVKPLALITFNPEGDILTSEKGLDNAMQQLPPELDLAALAAKGPTVFESTSRSGEKHVYASVPILPETAFALGAWPSFVPQAGLLERALPAGIFPLVMWLASLGAAMVAMNRLVIRHIRLLGRQMRSFAADRTLPQEALTSDMSGEMVEMEQTFLAMAESILQDEARLEDALYQKTVLMREVHHRVKNNLQLISSIMNMQMRRTTNPETRAVLQRLQERVLGLATIHRNLYQNEDLGHLDAGQVLRELVDQVMVVGGDRIGQIDVRTELDKVILVPDQAVPLSLLVSEALTNALKYLGQPSDNVRPWLRVTLRVLEDGRVMLKIANSLAPGVDPSAADPANGGLGTQLIRAFAGQLEATLQTGREDSHYEVTATFAVAGFADEPNGGR